MNLKSFTKSESKSTQDSVMSQIKDFIKSKNLEPGDKLPSERSLEERFGVSR